MDDGTRKLRREVYEFWPGELAQLFERAGLPRKSPPPFVPGTSVDVLERNGEAPEILAPAGGTHREILLASAKTIPLRVKAEADVRDVYWFAGNAFIGKAAKDEMLSWKCGPGAYQLTALDDHGRAGTCSVTVI